MFNPKENGVEEGYKVSQAEKVEGKRLRDEKQPETCYHTTETQVTLGMAMG